MRALTAIQLALIFAHLHVAITTSTDGFTSNL